MAFSSQRRKSVSEFVKKRPNYPGLEDTFRNFCETKAGPAKSGFVEMDGKTFAKVFKDCGLMGNKKGQLSTISIDINFSKCKICVSISFPSDPKKKKKKKCFPSDPDS